MTDEKNQGIPEDCAVHDYEKGETESSPAPEVNEPRQPTVEELAVIRAEMLKMCQGNYRKFIDSIRELPIHPMAMHQAFLYFDTGSLWMKEMIEYAPLIQKAPAAAPVPENTNPAIAAE